MAKIVRIETHLAPQQAVVRVLSDDGAEGIGQTSPYRADITVDVLHKMIAPFFLGNDPWDLERLGEECLRRLHKFPGSFVHRALCGIDTALWDRNAKCAGVPVYQLLGGADRHQIPMYASSMQRQSSPEEEADRVERAVEEGGFRCAKIKVGEMMGRDEDSIPGRTERLIPLMRERLGPDVGIHADGNGGYTPAKAIQVGRLLEEHAYYHFEEPCPFTELENTAAVAAALDIPVAGGEQDYSLDQFHRMIAMRAVDIVQPDIGYIGGITPARKVALMAEAAGMPCTPHCANQSMLQVFTLHFAAAMPACTQYQEWSIEDNQGWAKEIYEPAVKVEGGSVSITNAPGWGISIMPSYLEKAEKQVSAV